MAALEANDMENILNKRHQRGFTIIELGLVIWFVIGALVVAGWVMNLHKFSQCDFEAPYKAEIVYGIGILPPVGAVTGWIDVGV